jgi:glycosyltransferase involved in cell wall biosynthesis
MLRVSVAASPTWRRVLGERALLPRALSRLGASLLHLESLPVPRLSCPVVLTVHDLRDLGPHRRRAATLFAGALRRGSRRAAALVAPSLLTAAAWLGATGAGEIAVVPGALDEGWADGPTRASPWPGAFLHVGHLEPRKDLRTLLHAHAAAGQHAPLPPLVLAGRDGGCAAPLRRLAAELGIAGAVHFAGEVDAASLRGLYAAARAVLVPSRCEGFGMPALEALAFGRPVAVSDAGALPEVVADAGRVVAAGDVGAWAETLAQLAAEPDTPAAVAARRARAACFGAADAARLLLAVWRRVSARAASPGSR